MAMAQAKVMAKARFFHEDREPSISSPISEVHTSFFMTRRATETVKHIFTFAGMVIPARCLIWYPLFFDRELQQFITSKMISIDIERESRDPTERENAVCQFVCLFVSLSVCLSVFPFIRPSVRSFVCP